ncbi:hypothetical protein EV191_103118 [Tamaricihabitans halophyticus]|uniref:Uncharacterized protein n=1 Tax=Tamaricihabitans halophyticus TaxID=1262583 RepID=A0A4R2QWJ5_9PSEU|nr:hypothetical protein [Tamaricihabitans halophyticus]TCP54077.1 hypothetical protein EV191_103118 [Tamaricihabitans halophyticus]
MATVLRLLVVLGLLGSAWIHFDLWQLGYRDIDTIGPLFLVNVIAGAVLAIAVLVWRHWLPLLGAVGFGLATLGGYLLSVTVGLFGMQNELYWQAEPILAAVAELGCIVFGLAGVVMLRSTERAGVASR